ncbi:hypothetical protein [Serpentinicella alkaliphila]|uniref:Uncharacterized protein n=1 Tax=Serpentinicella alkaliphila TaxID=1734049 RepID=A0A4R2TY43_9FIRM|nr:hypothetical protein [Serpentinicella alkaliphila]QUH26762.1 hypothetical protein HZR23_14215 [Serpentinicella alkaliphila]TCQ07982.1 hypothetical protein EDD79_100166 [Serpentinicella alkaliphila]
MNCVNCENCKENLKSYFCVSKNDFVINTSISSTTEKIRSGWKKGLKEYEIHRRKLRKEVEI